MLDSAWSEVLRSDLDKLAQVTSKRSKPPVARLKEGERRVVTILFLDIQGFTAMSEKLDPEDVQLIIDNCFKILTNEIEKYNGYIDKYEGDRMMALFGSRQASETDCQQALRAGLGMQVKFLEINKILADRDIRIGIRIGVNTGLVVTGHIGKGRDQDFTVMGDAVNLASRLESNAPAGEIMISEDVRKVSGDAFLYDSLGEIEVKGKSEPISVFCVKGLNPNRSERWERSPFTQRSGYVGREKENEIMRETAERLAKEGKGVKTLGFSASAGVGKSRLVYEFAQSLRSSSKDQVLFVRGSAASDHSPPFGIFSDLIQRVLASPELGSKLFEGHSEESKASSLQFEPMVHYIAGKAELDDRMKALEPQALRLEIHLAIRFVLECLADFASERQQSPVVIHLEDLQWIDAASLEALEFLGSNLDASNPIFFVWTYRPEFEPSTELCANFHIEEVKLKPLTREDCRAILRNVLGDLELNSRDEMLLVNRCGGNPFFMEELIQSLIDDGIIQKEGEKWRLVRPIDETALPDTINRMILSRIDRIPIDHKETLMAASVIGETIPKVLMDEVGKRMGMDAHAVLQRVEGLKTMGFLYKRGQSGPLGEEFAFRHALTRDVVYSTLLNHNKKILHDLTAQSFEGVYKGRLSDHAVLLFHHYSHAAKSKKTVHYGLSALDQMLRQYATKEGLEIAGTLRSHLGKDLPETEKRKAEIQITEAEIRLYDLLGKRDDQLKGVEELEAMCKAITTPDLEAKSALHRATYFAGIGDFRQTKEHTNRGLKALKNEKDGARLRMDLLRTLGIASYSMGQYPDALDSYEKGLATSKQLGDRSAEGAFYNTIGLVHFNMGKPDEALKYYMQAHEIMMEIGDRRGQGNSLGNQGLVYWTLGDYSHALEQLHQSHKIFQEIGFRKGQAVTLGNIGVIHHKLGQYQEALRYYEKALELRRQIHDRAGEGYDLVNIGVVYQHLADYVKAIEHFEAGEWLAREVGSNYLLSENLNCLGIVYRVLGEKDGSLLDRAKEKASEALGLALEHELIPAQVKAYSNLARVLFLLGEKSEAQDHSDKAMKLIEKHQSGVEGSEEDAYINHYHILNEMGREEEARACLEVLVQFIEKRAAKIKEAEYRKSFLEEVRQNRYALREWKKRTG